MMMQKLSAGVLPVTRGVFVSGTAIPIRAHITYGTCPTDTSGCLKHVLPNKMLKNP
jgi:hypothetical protein